MTTQNIITYYANLLIAQFRNKPKASAHVAALVTPVIMDQLPSQIMNGFKIGTAIGAQLDVIGKYVGVVRSASLSSGPVTLNDADFTVLIQIAIIINNSDGTLYAIQNLLNKFFAGQILVFDYKNMQMSYLVSKTLGSENLVKVFLKENLLPVPMGVQVSSVIYSANINTFFGFRTYALSGYNVSPLNNYTSYHNNYPWVSYSDAINL